MPAPTGETLGAVVTAVEGPSGVAVYFGSMLSDRVGVLWTRLPGVRCLGRIALGNARPTLWGPAGS